MDQVFGYEKADTQKTRAGTQKLVFLWPARVHMHEKSGEKPYEHNVKLIFEILNFDPGMLCLSAELMKSKSDILMMMNQTFQQQQQQQKH